MQKILPNLVYVYSYMQNLFISTLVMTVMRSGYPVGTYHFAKKYIEN